MTPTDQLQHQTAEQRDLDLLLRLRLTPRPDRLPKRRRPAERRRPDAAGPTHTDR